MKRSSTRYFALLAAILIVIFVSRSFSQTFVSQTPDTSIGAATDARSPTCTYVNEAGCFLDQAAANKGLAVMNSPEVRAAADRAARRALAEKAVAAEPEAARFALRPRVEVLSTSVRTISGTSVFETTIRNNYLARIDGLELRSVAYDRFGSILGDECVTLYSSNDVYDATRGGTFVFSRQMLCQDTAIRLENSILRVHFQDGTAWYP